MGSFYTEWVDEKYLHSISFSRLEYFEMKEQAIWKPYPDNEVTVSLFLYSTVFEKRGNYFCGSNGESAFSKPLENSRLSTIPHKGNICKNIKQFLKFFTLHRIKLRIFGILKFCHNGFPCNFRKTFYLIYNWDQNII